MRKQLDAGRSDVEVNKEHGQTGLTDERGIVSESAKVAVGCPDGAQVQGQAEALVNQQKRPVLEETLACSRGKTVFLVKLEYLHRS